MAMDVVDTLRHRERLIERELNEEVREEQLIARLRALYMSQGLDVPDSVIAQGVKALKDSRFVYTLPKPSFERSLGRGRNEDFSSPPAQIPASAANAPGSSLGSNVGEQTVWTRPRSSAQPPIGSTG